MSAARLRVVDGRLSIVVDAEHSRLLHVLLERALASAAATGQLLPAGHEIAEAARRAAALHAFGAVPAQVQEVASGDVRAPGLWMSPRDAAKRLGLSPRGVRKRAERHPDRWPSRLVAGRLLVRIEN